MKYLCSDCERLVEPRLVRAHGSQVEFTCPKCQAIETVPLNHSDSPRGDAVEKAASSTASFKEKPQEEAEAKKMAEDTRSCPKCQRPRGDEQACPSCGLIYSKWNDEEGELLVPSVVRDAWDNLCDRWDDDEAHQHFVSLCLEYEALAYAAHCYRSKNDGRAQEQLEKLTSLGVQAMQFAEAPTRLNPQTFRIVGWIIFVILCLSLATLAFMVRPQ